MPRLQWTVRGRVMNFLHVHVTSGVYLPCALMKVYVRHLVSIPSSAVIVLMPSAVINNVDKLFNMHTDLWVIFHVNLGWPVTPPPDFTSLFGPVPSSWDKTNFSRRF